MTEETLPSALPSERVATRPGAGGVAEKRRRIYQRHLLLILVIGGALIGADLYTSPGVQWAHFPLVPWFLVFALHTVGLKSRGYSLFELFVPPRQPKVREVYTVPLDYELVRTRQLRDGVATAAAALTGSHPDFARQAVEAADELVQTMEKLVAAIRTTSGSSGKRAEELSPVAQAAVEALDGLHQGIVAVEVLEEEAAGASVETVRERARALQEAIP